MALKKVGSGKNISTGVSDLHVFFWVCTKSLMLRGWFSSTFNTFRMVDTHVLREESTCYNNVSGAGNNALRLDKRNFWDYFYLESMSNLSPTKLIFVKNDIGGQAFMLPRLLAIICIISNCW